MTLDQGFYFLYLSVQNQTSVGMTPRVSSERNSDLSVSWGRCWVTADRRSQQTTFLTTAVELTTSGEPTLRWRTYDETERQSRKL